MPAPMPGCQETLWGQLLLGQIRRKARVDQTNPRGPSQSQVCCGSVRVQLVPCREEQHHAPKNTQSPRHAQGTR